MKSVQFFNLDSEDSQSLYHYYENIDNHEHRQRCHMILLRYKRYTLNNICDILDKKEIYVIIYIKAWYYWKFEGLLNDDFNNLYNSILELEKEPLPQPVVKKEINWKLIFSNIINFFEKFVNWVFIPFSFLFALIGQFISFITQIDYSKFLKSFANQKKNVIYNKGSRNINIINNIVNNINITDIAETFDVESLNKLIKVLEDLKNRRFEFSPTDKRFAWFFGAMDRFKDYPKIQKFILVGFAIYLYYNTVLKSGVLMCGVLGSTLVFNLHNSVTTPIIPVYSTAINQDSINNSLNKPTQDEEVYFDSFSPSNECIYLADVPLKSSLEILNDTTDYNKKDFYVANKDKKVHLQVAAYSKVQQAAFQRRNLMKQGFETSKVLRIKKKGYELFGVTIGISEQSDISNLSKMQEEWNKECKTERVRALIKTNE